MKNNEVQTVITAKKKKASRYLKMKESCLLTKKMGTQHPQPKISNLVFMCIVLAPYFGNAAQIRFYRMIALLLIIVVHSTATADICIVYY